jgi:hypothetical protein
MKTRRDLIGAAALMVCLGLLVTGSGIARAAEEPAKMADFLFVQNAKSVTYENGKLTLKGVSPATVLFSDRPERIAGHMATREWVPFWKEGKDSFLADPPNATLSIFGEGKITDVVMELKNPMLEGDDLSYEVKVLQGEMPTKGGLASLFIDVIGMPMTPLSYAGADRRMWRRARY